MSDKGFRAALTSLAALFTILFVAIVGTGLVDNGWNVVDGALDGFVNPFAAGYSTDVLVTWAVLGLWVVRDRQVLGVHHGWVALVLGVVPGVAVGLVAYLLIRGTQVSERVTSGSGAPGPGPSA